MRVVKGCYISRAEGIFLKLTRLLLLHVILFCYKNNMLRDKINFLLGILSRMFFFHAHRTITILRLSHHDHVICLILLFCYNIVVLLHITTQANTRLM